MTETAPVVCVNPVNECHAKPLSSGKLVSMTEAKVNGTLYTINIIIIITSITIDFPHHFLYNRHPKHNRSTFIITTGYVNASTSSSSSSLLSSVSPPPSHHRNHQSLHCVL